MDNILWTVETLKMVLCTGVIRLTFYSRKFTLAALLRMNLKEARLDQRLIWKLWWSMKMMTMVGSAGQTLC